MKKIICLIFAFFWASFCAFALEEDVILPDGGVEDVIELQEGEHAIIYEEEINPYSKEALRGIIEKEYDTDVANNLFEEQLKLHFKKGPLETLGTRLNLQAVFNEDIDNRGDSYSKFNMRIIDIGFRGKFRGGKESYNTLFNLSPVHENFFHRLVLDAWVETSRIKNNRLMFGTFRPAVGVEGESGAYVLPFLNRTQSARNFGNARKTGLRIKGNYKYFNYDLGGYSSDTWYSEFFPGVEADVWLGIKPLAKAEGKFGDLNIGGGYSAGSRNSHDFQVVSTAVQYNYKKFRAIAEYQNADGSNGASGITEKKRRGYNATLAYKITKKLEFLLRYDDFDPNKKISNNNTKEYSAGINYFLIGQGLRFMINYVFCDNSSAKNSHKIMFGTQLLL